MEELDLSISIHVTEQDSASVDVPHRTLKALVSSTGEDGGC
jgi:hypothetical protein